ncbi:unnamed protein product, partial [Polarella glacialis]
TEPISGPLLPPPVAPEGPTRGNRAGGVACEQESSTHLPREGKNSAVAAMLKQPPGGRSRLMLY